MITKTEFGLSPAGIFVFLKELGYSNESMINKILSHKAKSISSAGFILTFAGLTSSFLGLIRNRLLASNFGAGSQLDIYFTALRIPSFVSTVLITGAISVMIIPLFSECRVRSKAEGWSFVSAILNLFLVGLFLLSLLLMIAAPWLISLIAPGFEGGEQKTAILMMRIMLLNPIFLVLSTILSGVLQSFHRFLITSLAPLVYNVGIILGIIFLVPSYGLMGLAWGVVLGSFLHLTLQIPALLSLGFRLSLKVNWRYAQIKKSIKLAGPRIIGVMASQINLLVFTAVASTLAAGSIAVYNLAADFSQALIRLIGVSFATAAFPILSLSFAQKRKKDFINNFQKTFSQILFLIIPASILFFILRAQLVRIVLGAGQFGWRDTRLTAACLGLFALGIFSQALVTLISKAFGAFRDTKTPALINLFIIPFGIGFALFLVGGLKSGYPLQIWISNWLKLSGIADIRIIALPLAFSVSGITQFLLLFCALQRKLKEIPFKKIIISTAKILLATLIMSGATYFLLYEAVSIVDMETLLGLLKQTLIAGGGGVIVYILSSWVLKSSELETIKKSLLAEFKK